MIHINTLSKKFSGFDGFSAKSILFTFFLFLATAFFSCKEIGPNIILSNNGNDTTSQQKTVLMEDFTATDCANCPKARNDIDNLLASHPGRIEVVEVHEGLLSHPLLPGDSALKTPDGELLATLLGSPPYWPIGAVDRKAYEISPGNFQVLIDRGLWPTYVPQELDSALKVKLGLNLNYDGASRQLTGSVTVDFLETITYPLNITLLITESGIVAGQMDGLVLVSNYVHNDVLRDIITNYQGESVPAGVTTQGNTWTYPLAAYSVSTNWNADSCRIIAFVSKAQGGYDVLQAIGKPLN